MCDHCSNATAYVIAALMTALAIAAVLLTGDLTNHAAKAAYTSVGKPLKCDSSKHTKKYCDSFTIGKTDCRGLVRFILMIGKVNT
jgi:hypothetical protein